MNTLNYIVKKFKLVINKRGGTVIGNMNRTIMAQTLGELGFKEGAEVGVAEGVHAEVLCKSNPGVKLHCVDVWKNYSGYKYRGNLGNIYFKAMERLKPYDICVHKKFSMDAVKDFEDNSLDFVYIDAAHDFKNIAMDICEWSRKVRVGGIVFGHDFIRTYFHHVKEVASSYMRAHNIKPWFILKNDTKDPAFKKDCTGWMFIRSKEDSIWKNVAKS